MKRLFAFMALLLIIGMSIISGCEEGDIEREDFDHEDFSEPANDVVE